MARLKIIFHPDPRLRMISEPVTKFDADLRELVSGMQEAMVEARGIGLAAIQVAVPKRVLIIDIGELTADDDYIEGEGRSERRLVDQKKTSNFQAFINLEILESSGSIDYTEGCLSLPGINATVRRKEHLKVRYQDLSGNFIEEETTGLKSIVIQHELDHLNGVLFPDRIGAMQKLMVMNKYKKLQLDAAYEEDDA